MLKRIVSYTLPLALMGGCFGTCLLLPEPRKEQTIKAQLETTKIFEVPVRIYTTDAKPDRKYLDFKPFGDVDLIIYQSGKEAYTRNWYNRKHDDDFMPGRLMESAREQGLTE